MYGCVSLNIKRGIHEVNAVFLSDFHSLSLSVLIRIILYLQTSQSEYRPTM